MKTYKKFVRTFILYFVLSLCFIMGLNFIVDPIGLYRMSFQLQHVENKAYPEFVALKLYSKFDTAIIGTSRSQKIDHRYLNKYNINAKNLSLAASSIDINYELAKKAKELNKDIILFLDPYTLSKTLNSQVKKKRDKLLILKREINKLNDNSLYYYFKYLTSTKTFSLSVSTLSYLLRQVPRDYKYLKENKTEAYIKGQAPKGVSKSVRYKNYIPDHKLIEATTSLLTKDDNIIITPLVFEYYSELYKTGILEIYFDVIQSILDKNNTNVISFLYPNKDLLDNNLFDNSGSHFKHFYSKKIIDDIYSKNKKISILLTRDNFIDYKKQIILWLITQQKELNALQ